MRPVCFSGFVIPSCTIILYVASLSSENSPFAAVLERFTSGKNLSDFTTNRSVLFIAYWKAITKDVGSFLFGKGLAASLLTGWGAHNLYLEIAGHAVRLADKIRATLDDLGVPYLVPGITNQIFPILSDVVLEQLAKDFCFTEMERVSDTHRAIRFCTSWATTEENVDKLCNALRTLANS